MTFFLFAGVKIIVIKQPFIGDVRRKGQIIILDVLTEVVDVFCPAR